MSTQFERDTESMTKYLVKKLNVYLTAMCPAPYEPMQIYDVLFTKDQHAAIRLLRNTMGKVLETQSELYVAFRLPECIKVEFAQPVPCPPSSGGFYDWKRKQGQEWSMEDLPPEMREPLEQWAVRYIDTRSYNQKLMTRVGEVIKHCNTLGQIARIWPTLTGALPPQKRNRVISQRMQPKYPDALMVPDVTPAYTGWKLNPSFAPETFREYDDVLAAAFVLPDSMAEDQPVHVTPH